ncbi:hypothetical protein HY633_04440 [Candidatus Uhrbacteria bacterium]|nr:hypothetical protein [Candidatus Uhrbacteria bacterium]
MKVVAVIGKYFGTYPEIDKHIFLARQLARMVWDMGGFGVFTPHLNTAHFEALTKVNEPTYQEFDRLVLERLVDGAIVLPNWRASSGSRKEIAYMNLLNKPVFDDLATMVMWRDGADAHLFRGVQNVDGVKYWITGSSGVQKPPLSLGVGTDIDKLLNY